MVHCAKRHRKWISTCIFLKYHINFSKQRKYFYGSDIKFEKTRSSHQRRSIKKAVLKNFSIFTAKHLCWSSFLIKFQTFRSATLLKRESSTSVFLWILLNFQNIYFEENLRTAASGKSRQFKKATYGRESVGEIDIIMIWTISKS